MRMGGDTHASEITQNTESTPKALNTLANAEEIERKLKSVQLQHARNQPDKRTYGQRLLATRNPGNTILDYIVAGVRRWSFT